MEFAHPEYLVETDWLEAHLDEVCVLDVTAMLTAKLENRAERECFDVGHIPGSHFFDVASGKGVLSDPGGAYPWTWPDATQFAATMARFGISNTTRVILAARTPRAGIDNGTMWCTRAWWTMHHGGVNCAILNGGIEKWQSENRPFTDVPSPAPQPATFVTNPEWNRGLANRDHVLAALDNPAACVVDALAPNSFDGTGNGYGPRKGHITSAINVPMSDFIKGDTAWFHDAATVHACLTTAGLLDAERVITYCGGAIAATVDAFALALFDHANVSVYDGSLMEWAADASLPMTNPNPEADATA